MDFSTDLSYSRTMGTDMAVSSSPGPNNTKALDDRTGLPDQLGPGKGTTLGHLHGHRLRVRSQASVCPLVAKWPTDVNTNSSYGTRHGPRKQPELRCHHAPQLAVQVTMFGIVLMAVCPLDISVAIGGVQDP